MNERITELWDKAAERDDIFQHARHEQFAELIVRECMTICEDVAERNDPAIACYYEIKRTFRS